MGICRESPDLKSQGLMKNYQIYSKWWAASVALSETISIPVFRIRKLLETFLALSGFGHVGTCRHEPGGGGRNQVQAGTKSGTKGFESLASVIKNWLKISWSILLALQNIFSLQICGQFIKKKIETVIYFLWEHHGTNQLSQENLELWCSDRWAAPLKREMKLKDTAERFLF